MASNNAFKITKDTSARKNTRVGSIQSAVEAAAMKESHDYYVNRLTEGYKQQLGTMEQTYEDQIRELKTEFATTLEKRREDAIQETTAKTAEKIKLLKESVSFQQSNTQLVMQDLTEKNILLARAMNEKTDVKIACRNQIVDLRKKHEAELDKAHREKNSGPYRWTEIKFVKRYKSRVTTGAPKLAVKRSSAKFSELAQAALNSKSTESWGFEYNGRPLTEMEKTLTQVSDRKPGVFFE